MARKKKWLGLDYPLEVYKFFEYFDQELKNISAGLLAQHMVAMDKIGKLQNISKVILQEYYEAEEREAKRES